MEASNMPPETPTVIAIAALAEKVGELGANVGAMVGEMAGAQTRLEEGNARMASIETSVSEMRGEFASMDTRINGRVGKLERTAKSLLDDVGMLKRWRVSVTIVNRLWDRFTHHRFVTPAVTTAIGIGVTYLLTH